MRVQHEGLPVEDMPTTEHGRPLYAERYTLPHHNLTITYLNYGEHHNAADTVVYELSRPLVGVTHFHTTNGELRFTTQAEALLLADMYLIAVIHLPTDSAYHLSSGRDGYFTGARWDEQDRLAAGRLERGQRIQPSRGIGPLTLAEIKRTWTAGLGPAVQGRFPSAFGPLLRRDVTAEVQAVMQRLADSGDGVWDAFETLRDQLNGLGPAALPELLRRALSARGAALELLVYVLADQRYPPAMPHFVTWLESDNREVRFAAALTLDQALADERFGVAQLLPGGWVQHERLAAIIPDIQAWWRQEGAARAAQLAHGLQRELSRTARPLPEPPATPLVKRLNFIALNPTWVMLADGVVFQPAADYQLPHQPAGQHIIGGEVVLWGEIKPRPAAFVLDASNGKTAGVFIQANGGWENVDERLLTARPAYPFKPMTAPRGNSQG